MYSIYIKKMNHKSCFNGFVPDSILYFSSIWYWRFHDRNGILRISCPNHSVLYLIFSVLQFHP